MTNYLLRFLCCCCLVITVCTRAVGNSGGDLAVIAYYSGNGTDLLNYPVEKLTHIIYSFAHLRGNKLYVSAAAGNILEQLVQLKSRNPALKIAVALGGWGGCKTCSPVFAVAANRAAFAGSVKKVLEHYHLDGIDLDWEYPAVQGPVGHPYETSDKDHFTALVKALRDTLGSGKEISFAAGAFPDYLENSVDWKAIMPIVNRVHIMSYDLVNRLSVTTGHHTPIYSTSRQLKSTDYAVRFLAVENIPPEKLVIGIAFYARVYTHVDSTNHGLYQPGSFKSFVTYKNYKRVFSKANGYQAYWDEAAQAPYSYNAGKKLFATYDNIRSVQLKTNYAARKNLAGVMFWELRQDNSRHDLLNAIFNVKQEMKKEGIVLRDHGNRK